MCVYFVRNRKRAYVHVMYMFYSAFVWLSISNIFFYPLFLLNQNLLIFYLLLYKTFYSDL